MGIPVKTLSNGFSMPVYGLGTWEMGGGWNSADTTDDGIFIDAIRTAIDHGVTHIDTAELYGGGHAEELIARAKEGISRSKLLLASKVLVGMEKVMTVCYVPAKQVCKGSRRIISTFTCSTAVRTMIWRA